MGCAPMGYTLWDKFLRHNPKNPQWFKDNFEKLSPLSRMCNVNELCGPYVFLASKASSYMNGASLVVDGGWTAW